MNREERVRAALASKDVDRVPVATWMHLSQFDQDPISLAEAEVELTENMISITSNDAFWIVQHTGLWQSADDLL